MPILSWFEDYGDDFYYGYDMTKLAIDQAYLNIKNNNTPVFLYKKHKECLQCPYERLPSDNPPIILGKVPQYLYRANRENQTEIPPERTSGFLCDIQETFGEFGIYNLQIEDSQCHITTVKEPVSIIFPILTVILIYLAVILGIFLVFWTWRKLLTPLDETTNSVKPPKKIRVKSIDTFRGISITVMIFVNYGAGKYGFLDHAVWNGLHVADLVFPWFMWIMGACIPISLSSSINKQIPKMIIFKRICIRSVKLFCLGIFLSSGKYLDYLRIFGVLQRFGICYFAVSTICLLCINQNERELKIKYAHYLKDFIKLFNAWLVIIVILTIHCLIVFLVADDGCPKGYLGPGGWHDDSKYYNCTGGATGYIDRLVLGDHTFQNPTIKTVYNSQPFDPEGILGCLTSIVQVFLGVQAGTILLIYKTHSSRLYRWLSWSVITGVIGGILCGFSRDDGVIPVNKNLWSISFVMVTSCFAFALLSLCYVLIDVKQLWSGKPFYFAGMNAIIIYIGHQITYNNFPIRWVLHRGEPHGTHFIALFENLWGTGFWLIISYYLYKIDYFFTI